MMSDEGSILDATVLDGQAATDVGEPSEDVPDVPALDLTEDGPVVAPPASVATSDEAVLAVIAERDGYLDALQRLKAEFANARRRSAEQASTQRMQAGASLVEKLLPVLDSCEAALSQGVEEVRPISDALFEALVGLGLRRVDPVGEAFDPEQHEAVLHEEGDGEQIVTETLRTGYSWNDRVLRPAMVKVQG